MDNTSILIIDNNPSHLKLEKLALTDAAYQIRTANTADEAMKVLSEFKPHLILMEIQLPDIDGLELTRRLKIDPKYHDIVIVALTAYGMKDDKKMALDAGCDGYIAKPIDIATFPQVIANYINTNKMKATQSTKENLSSSE